MAGKTRSQVLSDDAPFPVTVWLELASDSGRRAEIVVVTPPATVAEVVETFLSVHPEVRSRITDRSGAVRNGVRVLVGPANIRDLDGWETVVPREADVWVATPHAGH
jgi:hypothetical protein